MCRSLLGDLVFLILCSLAVSSSSIFLEWYLIFVLLLLILSLQYLLVPILLSLPLSLLLLPRFGLLLLGSSQTSESFPLFHVLCIYSDLLNSFALCRSVARVLGVQFPDISKLHHGAILFKISTYA